MTDGSDHGDAPPDVIDLESSGEAVDLHAEARAIEAVSLLGRPLMQPTFAPQTRATLEDDLAAARADFERDPTNEMNIIWYGRRLAYLGRYNEALRVFTWGLTHHPQSYRLRRHSGHRLITLRRIEEAVIDLQRAAELARDEPDAVEPDGMPNEYGVPRSTTKTNILYHLGLAHYLQGEFEQALAAYRRCMELSPNDDMTVATAHWLFMTLRRLGRDDEAAAVLEPIRPEMQIMENDAYHDLLLMYKGERPPEPLLEAAREDDLAFATIGYGVGNWYLCNGEADPARAIFEEIVDATGWAAFGHIAAEAELARMNDQD